MSSHTRMGPHRTQGDRRSSARHDFGSTSGKTEGGAQNECNDEYSPQKARLGCSVDDLVVRSPCVGISRASGLAVQSFRTRRAESLP
jgi:hypothetical protein